MTESDEAVSSALSSLSSKATSPTGGVDDPPRDAPSQPGTPASPAKPKYNVRPKGSIPTDIHPLEYARQCIAAAESSRLNPYSLHPDEYKMLRGHLTHAQVTTYLNIRNGILRLWTRNPMIGVQKDEAIGIARDVRWFDVAALCFEWLVRKGYINYGCVEKPEVRISAPKYHGTKRKRKTIAVIGAGMAGLGCARQLEGLLAQFENELSLKGELMPKVVVLEGRDRVGGRVCSRGFNTKAMPGSKLSSGSRTTAEMGGMIVTGFDRGNPLNIIVRGQLALPYHALRPATTLYDIDGKPVDQERDQLMEKLYNDVLERVSDYKFKVPQPPTLEGDKDLVDACRDVSQEGSKTIAETELLAQSALASVPQADPATAENPDLVPVSSDRLTGRAHLEPGTTAVHRAAFKAKLMGWDLKPGIEIGHDIDLTKAVETDGATLGSVMDDAIHQYREVVDLAPQDLRLINWHIANLEYSNAINHRELSLGGWDLDAGNEWEGKHTMIKGGYQQVPRGLLHCPHPLDVRKNKIVSGIKYGSPSDSPRPSKIEFEDGSVIEADYIVSTIPLGVLKAQTVKFEPALPDWKMGAIDRLGFGILNKVIMVFDKPFWDQSRDIFGVLRDPSNGFSLDQKDYTQRRGRFFQWFNCTKTSGVPCLLALMAGDAAFDTETTSNESLISEALSVLRSVFGPSVPHPIEAVITRWGQDKFARGSYSYTSPSFQPDDYEVMAKPISNLFFAGEHTCGTHPATVHGAYISGIRAASEVLESLIGPIIIPTPLVVPRDTSSNKLKRKASAADLSQEPPKDPELARLEAHEIAVWDTIYKQLGDRPWKPAKMSANPYILYSKDYFDTARKNCEEGRRPGKGKPVPNEVRICLAKMWKEAPQETKKPYLEKAEEQKREYAAKVKAYNEGAAKWDLDALEVRRVYELEHPRPVVEEGWSRDRRAKMKSESGTYAEDSGSDVDF